MIPELRPRGHSRRSGIALLVAMLGVVVGCGSRLSPEEQLARARQSLSINDYRAASIQLQEAAQQHPKDPAIRLLLADVYEGLGDSNSAIQQLSRAEALGAPISALEPARLRSSVALGNFEEVLKTLDNAVPGLAEAERKYLRASALAGLGRHEEAVAVLRELAEAGTVASDVRVALVRSLGALGRQQEASSAADALAKLEPGNPLGHLLRGQLLASSGRLKDAATALREAVRLAPPRGPLRTHVQSTSSLAEVQLALGDTAGASETWNALARAAPDAPKTLFIGARLSVAANDLPAAAQRLQQLLNRVPEFRDAQVLLAVVQARQGNVAQAEVILEKLLLMQPQDLAARKILADIQIGQGRPQAARATLQAAADRTATDADLCALAGRAALALGEVKAAVESLECAVRLDTGNSRYRMDLAAAHLAAGQPEKALAEFDVGGTSDMENDSRRLVLRISALSAAGRRDEARAEAERVAAANPRDVALQRVVTEYLLSAGEVVRAREVLQAAVKASSGNPDIRRLLAALEFRSSRFAEAQAILEALVVAAPRDAASMVALAEIATAQGQQTLAIEWLSRARTQDATAVQPRIALARALARDGDLQGARGAIAEAIALGPRRVDVLITAAQVEQRAKKVDQALAYLDRATAAAPESPELWLLKGQALADAGRLSQARNSVMSGLALRPGWVPAVVALAFVDAQAGDLDRALEAADELAGGKSTRLAGMVLRGDLLASKGRFAEAAKSYAATLAVAPDSTLVVKLYQARRRAGADDPAVELARWVRDHPSDAGPRLVLAEHLNSIGQAKAAISEYESLAAMKPDNAVALNNLAWAYMEAGDARAEATARKAVSLNPNEPRILDTLGWVLFQKGETDEALELLRKAAAPAGSSDIKLHLAEVLSKSGRTTEARQLLGELLRSADRAAFGDQAERLMRELTSPPAESGPTNGRQ